MAQFKFKVGDRVRHLTWPEGTYAVVEDVFMTQVRTRRSPRGRILATRAADCEPCVALDRRMPIAGSTEKDNHWMESGLVADDHALTAAVL